MTTPTELLTPPEHPENQPPLPVVVTIQPETPTPPSLQEIEAYVKATGGSLPYPRTPESYANLPKTARAQVEQILPAMAQRLGARVEVLPAALELKIEAGYLDYTEAELQILQSAGYHDTVAQTRAAAQAHLEAVWLAGHQARAEHRAANAEAEREASLAQCAALEANRAAAARARYLSGR